MYNQTHWLDKVVDPDTGEVIQQGTPQSAGNFNNMENGIQDGAIAEAQMMIYIKELEHRLDNEAAVEEHTVTLTNNQKYPFNNSKTTIDLTKVRTDKTYVVDVEITAHSGGEVGDIKITDKLLNGFKVEFDGSATSVTVTLRIKGGL
ncbi:MAG: hypothetical protein IJ680_04860 [Paludibacteraceae bacterium]|nr:hypothetical protein [Paludibacteraceae bacterium]